YFFFSSRRRHTRFSRDWSSDVCSSDLEVSDGTHHFDGLVSHFLVTAVAQRHAWRHRDRVAGMHAHRVEVFDGTDNDHIVGTVARSEERRVGKERSSWSAAYSYIQCLC